MTRPSYAALLTTLALLLATPAQAATQCGKASWYAMTSKTASGERASPNTMTAAHRTLPFGTKVRVTNQRNGRSVILRINDRGPFVKGRVIDVTKKAAAKLGFLNSGWTRVAVTSPDKKPGRRACG
ncbi:MAG: septal ring lytic transglycosylase RlpA family protein [Rhizobiaceae bacterium]|nr:septal ring lytic transglycosylase RlpA family protein [Rhizobiaceae bacterium]